MDELKIDDVYTMLGRLYLNNFQISGQAQKLQEQLTALQKEVVELRSQVAQKVLTVQPKESEAA